MSRYSIPSGPTEAEVREHFGDQIKRYEILMRPAYTSIWALEDGTLLWDWRNGYADLSPAIKTIIYVTGSHGLGKCTLVHLMGNAVKISLNTVNSRIESNILSKIEANARAKTIAFTAHTYQESTRNRMKQIAEELGVQFLNINLTRK
jgi:hypothetical protein